MLKTNFLSDPFDFSSSKTGITGSAQYAIHRKCFGDLNLWCEGGFLKVEDPPPPPPTVHPPPRCCTGEPPWLATDEANRSLVV